MKNKPCFAPEGPHIEESELGNLRQCVAQLHRATETILTKLFAVIIMKRVKADNVIPTVMYGGGVVM